MVSFRLDGKIALVTGASRGIGRSIAQTLAEYGAEVILVSRKMETLTQVATEITGKGGKALAIACHMGDIERHRKTYSKL